jgi:hypothetical protein
MHADVIGGDVLLLQLEHLHASKDSKMHLGKSATHKDFEGFS